MEKPLVNDWIAALKKNSNLLSDSAVKDPAAVIAKSLQARTKSITGLTMAQQGVKATVPPLLKTTSSLYAEAKATNKNLGVLADKYKKGSKDEKLATEAKDMSGKFLRLVSDNDLKGTNITSRYEVKVGAVVDRAEKTWQELMKLAKKMPRSVRKELEKHKSPVEKLLKQIKSQAANVQKAHKGIMGYNAKLSRDEALMGAPSRALKAALKDLVAKEPDKMQKAATLAKELVSIENTMRKFTI